jgi:hypothetical protein
LQAFADPLHASNSTPERRQFISRGFCTTASIAIANLTRPIKTKPTPRELPYDNPDSSTSANAAVGDCRWNENAQLSAQDGSNAPISLVSEEKRFDHSTDQAKIVRGGKQGSATAGSADVDPV